MGVMSLSREQRATGRAESLVVTENICASGGLGGPSHIAVPPGDKREGKSGKTPVLRRYMYERWVMLKWLW